MGAFGTPPDAVLHKPNSLLTGRRHALHVKHPVRSLLHVGFDVLATSEVIEGVQALEDRAEYDDRPLDCDDEDLVEIIELVKRAECGSNFGVRFNFSGEWPCAREACEEHPQAIHNNHRQQGNLVPAKQRG